MTRSHKPVVWSLFAGGGFPWLLRAVGRRASPRLRQRLRMSPGVSRQLDWSRVFTREQTDRLTLEMLPSDAQLDQLHAVTYAVGAGGASR